MRYIEAKGVIRVFNDDITIHETLNPGLYEIWFDKEVGFTLVRKPIFEINEKIYGVSPTKVQKVLNTYANFNRNLGVILSGEKGIGKSLFAKKLAIEAVANGLPVLMVNKAFPNIENFIQTIDQECVVLFDEFDKVWGYVDEQHNENAQNSLLTLFDGVSYGKKLFVITCNKLTHVNEYIVNRPGRFHYHFRFKAPSAEEVREYMQDKLDKKYWGEIDSIVSFAIHTNLNYDALRSIAFEISLGISFDDAIKDLNIIYEKPPYYRGYVYFKNGKVFTTLNFQMSLYSGEDMEISTNFFTEKGNVFVGSLTFNTHDVKWDTDNQTYKVNPQSMEIQFVNHNNDNENPFMSITNSTPERVKEAADIVKELSKTEVDKMILQRVYTKDIHYSR